MSSRTPSTKVGMRATLRHLGILLGGALGLVALWGLFAVAPVGADAVTVEPAASLRAQAAPEPQFQPPAPGDAGPEWVAEVEVTPPPRPFEGHSDQELRVQLSKDPESLGVASIGKPNRGALFNGLRLVEGPLWDLRVPDHSFTTPLVAGALRAALGAVNRRFPDTPRLGIGDISKEGGGYLRPHRSHQSGLDVDMGYYYRGGYGWYIKATADTLDRARTLCLVRALAATGSVEYIFIDRAVQELLREHAEIEGASSRELDALFGAPPKRGLVRHTWGHDDHIHVRFNDRQARLRGRRLNALLKERGRYK